jgi:hypothetical protein
MGGCLICGDNKIDYRRFMCCKCWDKFACWDTATWIKIGKWLKEPEHDRCFGTRHSLQKLMAEQLYNARDAIHVFPYIVEKPYDNGYISQSQHILEAVFIELRASLVVTFMLCLDAKIFVSKDLIRLLGKYFKNAVTRVDFKANYVNMSICLMQDNKFTFLNHVAKGIMCTKCHHAQATFAEPEDSRMAFCSKECQQKYKGPWF